MGREGAPPRAVALRPKVSGGLCAHHRRVVDTAVSQTHSKAGCSVKQRPRRGVIKATQNANGLAYELTLTPPLNIRRTRTGDLGCHGTRYVRHARGWYAYGVRTVRGAQGQAALRLSTEAPGRTCKLSWWPHGTAACDLGLVKQTMHVDWPPMVDSGASGRPV
eukprot:scaffold87898_cov68-Phaeocystis_antarctica.AAC.2